MNCKAGRFFRDKAVLVTSVLLWAFFCLTVILPLFYVFCKIRAENFVQVFTSQSYLTSIRNTILECCSSTILAVVTGYLYAYAVVRGNLPFKKLFAAIPVIHLVTPPFVGGLSFLLLFGRQGFVTRTLLGMDVSIYGFWGLLFSQTLCFFPMAYLICCQTLRGVNPSIEQAARSMGAGRLKVFMTVTLPLSFTGILSSLLFIAVSVLSDFGNPHIVGGRFRVLAEEIYAQLTGWIDSGTGALLGLLLLFPSVVLFAFQNRLLKNNVQKLATIGGKGTAASVNSVSKPVNVLLTVFCSFIGFLIVLQFLSIVAGAFQKLWGVNTAFTLDHIKALGRYTGLLLNTLMFAFVSAVLATIISCITAYCTHRMLIPGASFLDSICQLPSAIPGTLFGLALSCFSSAIHFKNSVVLIVVAMTVSFLPFSYRLCASVFAQLKMTLDDGARSLGAGHFKVLFSIILPLCASGLFSSFMYDFVRGVGTISSVIFLVSFNTGLASIKILNLAEQGDWGKSASLALVLTLITFIILAAGKIVSSRFETKIWNENQ